MDEPLYERRMCDITEIDRMLIKFCWESLNCAKRLWIIKDNGEVYEFHNLTDLNQFCGTEYVLQIW
jgi:hypothetical protein